MEKNQSDNVDRKVQSRSEKFEQTGSGEMHKRLIDGAIKYKLTVAYNFFIASN